MSLRPLRLLNGGGCRVCRDRRVPACDPAHAARVLWSGLARRVSLELVGYEGVVDAEVCYQDVGGDGARGLLTPRKPSTTGRNGK